MKWQTYLTHDTTWPQAVAPCANKSLWNFLCASSLSNEQFLKISNCTLAVCVGLVAGWHSQIMAALHHRQIAALLTKEQVIFPNVQNKLTVWQIKIQKWQMYCQNYASLFLQVPHSSYDVTAGDGAGFSSDHRMKTSHQFYTRVIL